MAVNFTCIFATLCCLALWGSARTSHATYVPPPHSTMKPGFPVPMNTSNPGVRKAARFGVYKYNNSSNDVFLFKESQINKAMVQIVRGLKYMLHVEIGRTVCEKKEQSTLDSCHFQRKKNLQQCGRCVHTREEPASELQRRHVPALIPSSKNTDTIKQEDRAVFFPKLDLFQLSPSLKADVSPSN